MTSMSIFSIVAACIGHSCIQNKEKQPAFSHVYYNLDDFSSRIGQHGQKAADMTLKSVTFGSFELFRKIHISASVVTHRPTTRMMLTSLDLVPN
jgi:hypothetical protein